MPNDSPRKIAASIQTALYNASVKLKQGEKLTAAETKLCDEYSKAFAEYMKNDDLDEYFNVNKSDNSQQTKANIPSPEQQKGIFNSSDPYPEKKLLQKEIRAVVNTETPITAVKKGNQHTYDYERAKTTNNVNDNHNSLLDEYPALITAIFVFVLFVLITLATSRRTGCECRDGTVSSAIGSGACSHHGGVDHWNQKYWWE